MSWLKPTASILFFSAFITTLIYYNYLMHNNDTFIKKSMVVFEKDQFERCLSFGWILSSVYEKSQLYLQSFVHIQTNLSRLIRVQKDMYTIDPYNQDYREMIHEKSNINHPYSSWVCLNTSSHDPQTREYCLLKNIYFASTNNTYYFFRNPHDNKIRSQFLSSHGVISMIIIEDLQTIKNLNLSVILTRPIHIGGPPDGNYAHGFLERCGPLFWVLAECQSHPSYVDPSRIQFFYSSLMDTDWTFQHVWQKMERRSDGTYEHTSKWNRALYAMFSHYPLLTYRSFINQTIMFRYLLFTGTQASRSAAWGIHYFNRPIRNYPFDIQQYRRAYLAFAEWILFNFQLRSKFQLTPIQMKLQVEKRNEEIPMCYRNCHNFSFSLSPTLNKEEFMGEWIVVLNRAGVGRREILNADDLVAGLLQAFPDHQNPYLRVWPHQMNFDEDLYQTAKFARSIRLLIGMHGAGLSNTLFMRPGAILFEVTPPGCDYLAVNFRRWAEVFNLQHALWTDSFQNEAGSCDTVASARVNVGEMVRETINLIQNEHQYRTGFLKRALDILHDETLVEHPAFGPEKIF